VVKNIPAGEEMLITFTNIKSAISTRPTSGALGFNLTTYKGDLLEKTDYNLTFKNINPIRMNDSLAGVNPNLWDKGEHANYTLIFTPIGFEVNM